MVQILYQDPHIVVCIKPCGVVSQDAGENSMPALLKKQLNTPYVGVVHRLDREVGGLMVFALTEQSTAVLNRYIQDRTFQKDYLAVLCGKLEQDVGELNDLLFHDRNKNKTYVVARRRNGVKEARLRYQLLQTIGDRSLVLVNLHTGRTHQIRVQFASRKLPLWGDRKYGGCNGVIGLWSYSLAFPHPFTGKHMSLKHLPPDDLPWSDYSCLNMMSEKT